MNATGTIALGEAVNLINGDRGKNYPDRDAQTSSGHCLFLNTKNVRQGYFDFAELAFIDKERHSKLGGGTLCRNDIVVTIRGTLGNTAIYKDDIPFDVVRINSAMLALRPKPDFDPDFIERFLRSTEFLDWVGLNQRGSAQPHLRTADIEAARLPLVPIRQQGRIVAKIDSLTGKSKHARDHLDHIPRLVEKYKQAVLAAAFRGDLTREWRARSFASGVSIESLEELRSAAWQSDGKRRRYVSAADIDWKPDLDLPTGWLWASVDQLSFLIQYGSSAKTAEADAGVAVLRMGNLQNGEIDLSSLKYLPSDHGEFPDLLLDPGDVLFNRTNSPELVGKTAVYLGELEQVSFASYLIRIKTCGIRPHLLSAYINSAIGREWVASVVNQQVGQANVNGTKLRQLGVPVMPGPEQEELLRRIQSAFKWIDRLASEATSARSLIDRLDQSVLAKAFRGELVPQDPADEPASALLQRIRAERGAAPKARRGRRAKADA
ncbi:restriction endonuclease subunit S [Mesorhizobium sp. M0045]|uniref:restriction endonuclease subunit S n=1 Tax=Mesorhizobium sp. M0045 TaxID=2956857 RepID=UPI0033350373